MSTQPSGRRTGSLFDGRYRYDHIYPRGRSGETLRAYDTLDSDRPVVIKRPAPQDAPPMRAGQEVSIRTERQALERLSGHPVLTELRGSGTFRVGGHTHAYIVMDRARGRVVEEMVLEAARHGERLPELEVLVIVDRLLDLLAYAHDRQVIYNDVDAKHLFWERESYQLKVIDWGNAVFLDEPGALPTANRASDIYQCGELLYFILTGGSRLAVSAPEEEDEGFFVNFGADAEHISPKLRGIITRAVHPDPKQRFGTIEELRHALADYRAPLERERDARVARVRKRVRPTASQQELEALREELAEALAMDPGFPQARALDEEIAQHLQQIQFQADLDAIRIYLESANWARALALLHELQPRAGEENAPLLRFLIAATAALEEAHIAPPPQGFSRALDALFGADVVEAGRVLLTTPEGRADARRLQWLLAEQLAVHVPQVVLLRPHLVRLRELGAGEDARAALDAVEAELERPPLSGLTGLAVIYEQVADALGRLEEALEAERAPDEALAAVVRAERACGEIVARLEEVGRHVFSDPQAAADYLRQAAAVDPTSPHFEALHDYFDEVHQAVGAAGSFRPRADGKNLRDWFEDVAHFLRPYLDDLPDPQLHAVAEAIQQAAEGWTTAVNYLALGRRAPTVDVLQQAAETVRPINEHIAAWLGALANRVPDAAHAEKLSPNEALADKLIEGWRAWDRGDGIQAAESGRRARELARTDGERLAADRLIRLGELLDGWAAAGGCEDPAQTDQAEAAALAVLLSDEERERRTFAEQMPNTEVYLKTMKRGLVVPMQQSSSAGWRALYLHHVLRGMLALFDDRLDDASFWREAALRCFDAARTHRAFQIFDRALTSRLLIQKAQRALNAVRRPTDLDGVRQAINVPLAGEMLAGVEHAVAQVNEALRHWSDGDFYAARQALESALTHAQEAAESAGLEIAPFLEWLASLRDDAAALHQLRLKIEQAAASTAAEPDPAVLEAHEGIVALTLQRLGSDYVHQLRQWREMYAAVLETYTTQRMTRDEKLAAFSRHFASLFIADHPAYPLFRHWEQLTEQLPPDVDEATVIPLEGAGGDVPPPPADDVAYLEGDAEPLPAPASARERRARTETAPRELPWNWIIGLALVALVAFGALMVWRRRAVGPNEPIILPPATAAANVASPMEAAPLVVAASATPSLTPTAPSPTPPAPTSDALAVVPSATPTPFVIPTTPPPTPTATPTLIPTSTRVPTDTPAPTDTPQAVAAAPADESDLLAALSALPQAERPWPRGAFVPGAGGVWVLSTAQAGLDTLLIEIPPALLDALFRPGAAGSLRRVDAVLELADYAPQALETGAVAFGLGIANANDEQTIGQVQIGAAGIAQLGLNQNGTFRASTEYPLADPQVTLSLRRTSPYTISFYVDERRLGDSVVLYPQGEPLTLLLFVSGPNVTVNVHTLAVNFNPRDEIP